MADNIEGMNTLTGSFGTLSPSVVLRGLGVPATVTVLPGSGCTVKAQYTTSSEAAVVAGSATWVDWATGAVTANTQVALNNPVVAVKFVRTVGGVESTYEICA